MNNRPDWTEWILQKNNEAKAEKIPVPGTPLHFQHHKDLPGKIPTSRYGVYHGDKLIGEVDTNSDHQNIPMVPKEYMDHIEDAAQEIYKHHVSKHGIL